MCISLTIGITWSVGLAIMGQVMVSLDDQKWSVF